MNLWILAAGAAIIIVFVWTWIGIVMVRHLSMARRLEQLLHIENPLPEEERELENLQELQLVEGSKVRSAKWTLAFFMLAILAAVVYAVINPTFRTLLGMDTVVSSIWMGVLIIGFFCMPTYMGLHLASFNVKVKKRIEKVEKVKETKAEPKAPEPKPAAKPDEKAQTA
jgi:hypothetical protein